MRVQRQHRTRQKNNKDWQTLLISFPGNSIPNTSGKNDSTLTFPEKLMLMLIHVERVYTKQTKKVEDQSISWSNNGKSFVIRDKDALCKTWVPAFFGQAKFSSFTRKLYRWGFRKVNVSINDKGVQIVVFSNENFQRDDVSRLCKMQSITAAKIRNQLAVRSGPKEATPDTTAVGISGNAREQPSFIEQLLRERISAAGAGNLSNPALLQYKQERDQEILRNRNLLASQLGNASFPSVNSIPSMENVTLLARQQAVLNRYRQSPTSLPTTMGVGNSSPLRLNLAARSQIDNLRLLEALDRQRTANISSLNSDGAYEQLLLQRQLRAAQGPSVDLATSMQSLDAYALIRRELESNLVGQNIRAASLQQQQQQMENRSAGNTDRRYLATLAALLQQQQQQNNNR